MCPMSSKQATVEEERELDQTLVSDVKGFIRSAQVRALLFGFSRCPAGRQFFSREDACMYEALLKDQSVAWN